MENTFNEKQSLELIAKMIENTKANLGRGSGNSMIAWGVGVLFASILVGVALYLTDGNPNSNWLWFFTPLYSLQTFLRMPKTPKVITRIDKMTAAIWRVIIPVTIALPLLFLAFDLYGVRTAPILYAIIPFIEMLIVSMGIASTGAMIAYKPIVIGGVAGILMSFCALLITEQYILMFWFAVWALVSMVIPGIKLNKYAKKNA